MQIPDIKKKYGGLLFESFMKRVLIIQVWPADTF